MELAFERRWTLLEIMAALVGLFFAICTSFIGFMIPLAGWGHGLASVAVHYLFLSLGIELPLYLLFLLISRRWLVCACYAMCAINFVGAGLLERSNILGALHLMDFVGITIMSVLFPGELTSIAVVLVALYLRRSEMTGRSDFGSETGGDVR